MLILLSPAKTLDMQTPARTTRVTQPEFLPASQALVDTLRSCSPSRLGQLMNISDALATLNAERFGSWQRPFTLDNARPAIQAFRGDVYVGLDADSLRHADLQHAQKHLRILSGLYGLLRPLDLMQAYRLEMGTKLATPEGGNLYEFWGARLTGQLDELIGRHRHRAVVNLASNEYFKAVRPPLLSKPVISPVFRDEKHGNYKVIGFFAKKARGAMARFLIEQRARDPQTVLDFDRLGYRYSPEDSSASQPVFLRSAQALQWQSAQALRQESAQALQRQSAQALQKEGAQALDQGRA